MIGIVDYGMGNLRSVQKALELLQCPSEIVTDARELDRYEAVILPGVGAFRDAIAELHRQDFVLGIRDYLRLARPFLGICLGMQLLFDRSYEGRLLPLKPRVDVCFSRECRALNRHGTDLRFEQSRSMLECFL